MKLAIAGDSAGAPLAKALADHLKGREGWEVSEVSASPTGADEYYSNTADRVASQLIDGTYDRAILVCGTGIGVAISANKVPGIRATVAHDSFSVERSILSNDCQILTLGQRVIGLQLARRLAREWLGYVFDRVPRPGRRLPKSPTTRLHHRLSRSIRVCVNIPRSVGC